MKRVRLIVASLLALIAAAWLAVTLAPHPAVASDLVNDVKKIREANRNPTIDIGAEVRLHIPIGMPRSQAEKILKDLDFKLYPQPKLGTANAEKVIATRRINESIVGFHDEIRVILEFSENYVRSSSGVLIHHAL